MVPNFGLEGAVAEGESEGGRKMTAPLTVLI